MATVYERRRALAKSLRDDLPSNVRVVSNPDHPFLLRAADILVSSNGTLTAIFTPSSEEQRRPSLLTTRLTLNRLALPPHTKTVLIVESTDQSYFGDLAQEFSEVVEYSRRHTLAGLIIRADLKGRDIPREIVAAAKLRFVDAMQGSILVRRRRFGRFPELVETFDGALPFGRKRDRTLRPVIDLEPSERKSNIARFPDGRVNSQHVLSIVHDETRRAFSWDSGVPYGPSVPPSIAVVPSWPHYPGDPDKLVRAAAFGGWALSVTDEPTELKQLAQRLNRQAEKALVRHREAT